MAKSTATPTKKRSQKGSKAKSKRAPAKAKAKARRRKPKPTGRPSKISQHVRVLDPKTKREKTLTVGEAVVLCLGAGTTIETAAGTVGIAASTIYDWLARAEEFRGEAKPPKSELPYLEFSEAVTRAREGVVTLALSGIIEAGKADWRALAWYLERSRPDDYGRRTRLDHGGVGGDGEKLSLAELFARAATDPSRDGDDSQS